MLTSRNVDALANSSRKPARSRGGHGQSSPPKAAPTRYTCCQFSARVISASATLHSSCRIRSPGSAEKLLIRIEDIPSSQPVFWSSSRRAGKTKLNRQQCGNASPFLSLSRVSQQSKTRNRGSTRLPGAIRVGATSLDHSLCSWDGVKDGVYRCLRKISKIRLKN